MSTKTKISWTDHTFNVAWGCTKVSPGCAHCYADSFARGRLGQDIWGPSKPRRTFGPKHWAEPIAWDRLSRYGMEFPDLAGKPNWLAVRGCGWPHLVFCSSMCDVWEDHPTIDAQRERLWPLIEATPYLTWQLLTKRPERIRRTLPKNWDRIRDRVWLGTSIENDDYTHRAADLQDLGAAVRFVSYEPALGPLDSLDVAEVDWVIFGGESGAGHRAPAGWQDWARSMRDRCRAAGKAFFFKQSPAARTEMGTDLDGETIHQFPKGAQP